MNESIIAYAAYSTNDDVRENSSSGGVFSVIANYVMRQRQGIVYGVTMSPDCYGAVFIRITSPDDLYRLRGSKYLQATLGDTFLQVKEDLKAGRYVLFSGTGCQISGLKAFLGNEYDNLLLLDVVCHGVPSPKLWRLYAQEREKVNGKIANINFRCKRKGWTDFRLKENIEYIPKNKDPFFQMFLHDYCLRPACYECFAKNKQESDISLADFWGVNKVAPQMFDNKGTSLVIVRTDKGKSIFNKCSDSLQLLEVNYFEAIKYNPAEAQSAKKPPERESFFQDLEKYNFGQMVSKYLHKTKRDIIADYVVSLKHKIKIMINMLKSIKGGKNFDTTSEYGILYEYGEKRLK